MSTPKEVCPTCKGTGTFRWTHRLTGAKSGTCATCMGSGKNSPVAAAAILNDLSPGTAEQIATRLIECFEAGQRRSDGSMALHPNRERWYIADAYRLAQMILGDTTRRGWVCVRHRCAKHYDVPSQNTNEASGSECGGCIAEDLKRVDREYQAAAKAWAADRFDLVRQRDESKRTADDNAFRAGSVMVERDDLRDSLISLVKACERYGQEAPLLEIRVPMLRAIALLDDIDKKGGKG